MPVSLTTIQQVTLTATERDAHGVAVAPSATLAWAVSDGAVLALEPAPDGLSCVCRATAPGVVTVSVTDPASGLSASEEIDVTAAPAATIEVTAGEPADMTAA